MTTDPSTRKETLRKALFTDPWPVIWGGLRACPLCGCCVDRNYQTKHAEYEFAVMGSWTD